MKVGLKIFTVLSVLVGLIVVKSSFANMPLADFSLKSAEEDREKIALAMNECQNVKTYAPMNNLIIHCHDSAFIFESELKSKSSFNASNVRISQFNFLHPGTSKTMFKDYKLVAKMLNHFDLVSSSELLGLVGVDLSFNRSLMKFLNDGPVLLQKYQKELSQATSSRAVELNKKIKKLKEDLAIAPKLYRVPGYLKVLKELRSLDASWSLVISPRGDSLLLGSVEEYSGFFYRKSKVDLANNPYCARSFQAAKAKACLATMRDEYALADSAIFFSRRPFIASFQSGSFKFSYLTSHVVFNAFGDEERQSEMLNAAFGTDVYENIGLNIGDINYARWVEMMLTARWMNNFKKRHPKEKLIYGGDTNLNAQLDVWQKVLQAYHSTEAVLGNSEKTTLSTRKFNSKNEETLGLANDYDHFIFKSSEFNNCKPAKAYNFLTNSIGTAIRSQYLIRDEGNLTKEKSHYASKLLKIIETSEEGEEVDEPGADVDIELDYRLTKQNEKKMNSLLDDYRAVLSSDFLIKNNELVLDQQKIEEKIETYKVRVFIKQLTNLNFYKVYQELISDHLPIYMDCSAN